MKVFCDTNVLVAAFLRGHPHHVVKNRPRIDARDRQIHLHLDRVGRREQPLGLGAIAVARPERVAQERSEFPRRSRPLDLVAHRLEHRERLAAVGG